MYCSTSSRHDKHMNYSDIKVSDKVIAAVDARRKIEAIKILREDTGLGLADAKDVVDRLARERKPATGPEPDHKVRGGGSVMGTIVLIAVILFVYFYFFAG